MNTDKDQRPSIPDEPAVGSGPDKITPETPICPTKKVRCNYWQNGGCRMVCWIEAAGHGRAAFCKS